MLNKEIMRLRALAADRPADSQGAGALQFGALVATFILLSFFLANCWMLVGGTLDQLPAIGILVLALGMASALCALISPRTLPWSIGAFVVLFAVSAWANAHVPDISYDGQDYHFTAIWALVNGWNPYHNSFSDFVAPGSDEEMWAPIFPKAAWVPGALNVAAGMSYEAAKNHTMLLLAGGGSALYGAGRALGLKARFAAPIAALAALNPIVIVELFSRMVDGVMAGYFAIFVSLAVVGVVRRDWRLGLLSLVLIALGVNTKASAILIFAILCGVLCLIVLLLQGWRATLQQAAVYMVAALLSIFVLGADPYLGNVIHHGNPIYPMWGPGHLSIDDEFRPPALKDHSTPVRLAMSIMGETSYEGPTYAVPFTVTKDEFSLAGDPEVFLGGFGPWFGGAFLIALVIAGALVASRPKLRDPVGIGLLVVGAVALSAFIMPESWAVRYVPQLWLAVTGLVALGFLHRKIRWVSLACAIALVGNVVIVSSATALRLGGSSLAIARQADFARQRPDANWCADVGASPARLSVFLDHGVRIGTRAGPPPRGSTMLQPMPWAYEYEVDRSSRPATLALCPATWKSEPE